MSVGADPRATGGELFAPMCWIPALDVLWSIHVNVLRSSRAICPGVFPAYWIGTRATSSCGGMRIRCGMTRPAAGTVAITRRFM